MSIAKLKEQIEQDTGNAEERYTQFVLDHAFGRIQSQADHNRRKFVIEQSGRDQHQFLKDTEWAERHRHALQHLADSNAEQIEADRSRTRKAMDDWRGIKDELQSSLTLMSSKISRANTDAEQAFQRLNTAKATKQEARRFNKALADRVEQEFKSAK